MPRELEKFIGSGTPGQKQLFSSSLSGSNLGAGSLAGIGTPISFVWGCVHFAEIVYLKTLP